jgi:hypothetical protein
LRWRYLRLRRLLLLRLLLFLMLFLRRNVVARVTTSNRARDCVMDVVAGKGAGGSAFQAAFCFR